MTAWPFRHFSGCFGDFWAIWALFWLFGGYYGDFCPFLRTCAAVWRVYGLCTVENSIKLMFTQSQYTYCGIQAMNRPPDQFSVLPIIAGLLLACCFAACLRPDTLHIRWGCRRLHGAKGGASQRGSVAGSGHSPSSGLVWFQGTLVCTRSYKTAFDPPRNKLPSTSSSATATSATSCAYSRGRPYTRPPLGATTLTPVCGLDSGLPISALRGVDCGLLTSALCGLNCGLPTFALCGLNCGLPTFALCGLGCGLLTSAVRGLGCGLLTSALRGLGCGLLTSALCGLDCGFADLRHMLLYA